MSAPPIQFSDPTQLSFDFESLFEELPVAVFVMTDQVCVAEFNRAAFELMIEEPPQVAGLLAGDALGCAHAGEPGGCGGTPHCNGCLLRDAVVSTFTTGERSHAQGRMSLRRGNSVVSREYVIGTALVSAASHDYVLLSIQAIASPPAPGQHQPSSELRGNRGRLKRGLS